MFREALAIGAGNATGFVATDIEDLISVPTYLALFNSTFAKSIGTPLQEAELPGGTRIVDRLNRLLESKGISIRPSGGFNHYAVATFLVSKPPNKVDKQTLARFEKLFTALNSLFTM
jgi:hypothetical protein